MNTKQIEFILELAKTQNFNKAAENLGVSQPTMTYQIKSAEKEIGFDIFDRSGKGAVLTPAGSQFAGQLKSIYESLRSAIEQGQNFSRSVKDDIRIAMPIRSAVYFLPEAIRRFSSQYPAVSVTPTFDWYGCKDSFLRGEQDILFAMDFEMKRVPDISRHPLFDSRFFLITDRNDPLSRKAKVTAADLAGRTLMVGGGSPPVLRAIQNRVVSEGKVMYFNSRDHDTTLTNVAAGRGVCIAPDFLNDHCEEFCWTPFDTAETIHCSLYTHKNEKRKAVKDFIKILQDFYL